METEDDSKGVSKDVWCKFDKTVKIYGKEETAADQSGEIDS